MIVCALVLLVFLPAVYLAIVPNTSLSPDELAEMGVCLDNPHS